MSTWSVRAPRSTMKSQEGDMWVILCEWSWDWELVNRKVSAVQEIDDGVTFTEDIHDAKKFHSFRLAMEYKGNAELVCNNAGFLGSYSFTVCRVKDANLIGG